MWRMYAECRQVQESCPFTSLRVFYEDGMAYTRGVLWTLRVLNDQFKVRHYTIRHLREKYRKSFNRT